MTPRLTSARTVLTHVAGAGAGPVVLAGEGGLEVGGVDSAAGVSAVAVAAVGLLVAAALAAGVPVGLGVLVGGVVFGVDSGARGISVALRRGAARGGGGG